MMNKTPRFLDRLPVRWLTTAPGWWFHGWIVLLGVVAMWDLSYPGNGELLALLILVYAVAASVLVWIIRLIGWLSTRGRSEHTSTRPWRFLIAPVIGLAVIALVETGAPLLVRFALSESAFETRPRSARRGRQPTTIVSAFTRLTGVEHIGANVLFYEKHGAFLGSAGFAYLPNGPSGVIRNKYQDAPQFTHLMGDWYLWTAGD